MAIETLYAHAHYFYWELKTIDEGLSRFFVDKGKREQLLREAEEFSRLNPLGLAELEQSVDRNIQAGFLQEDERENRIRAEREEIEFSRQFAGSNWAIRSSAQEKTVPGEPSIIDVLLKARTPEQIRQICADAVNWPISDLSLLPKYLSQFASEFIAAKHDARFPASDRKTSRLKQIWFLSRSLAGAVCGISARTAINLLGSVRPNELGDPSRLSKRTRRVRP